MPPHRCQPENRFKSLQFQFRKLDCVHTRNSNSYRTYVSYTKSVLGIGGRQLREILWYLVFILLLVPRQVCIRRSTIPGASHGVFSKVWIRRGTEMGPYSGRMCGAKDVKEHSNTWEVRGQPCNGNLYKETRVCLFIVIQNWHKLVILV